MFTAALVKHVIVSYSVDNVSKKSIKKNII